MKLAFCLFHYFPFGGLQRDFLRIAQQAAMRGHTIHVYTMAWHGDKEKNWQINIIKPRGLQNHTRCKRFATMLQPFLQQEKYDCVIGFNKMPYLDWYYAADVCYLERIQQDRSRWYRLLPRFQTLAKLEKDVFAQQLKTKILLIASNQKSFFEKHYHTAANRFFILPPGIKKNEIAPAMQQTIRESMRNQYDIPKDNFLLLLVGSGFKTKGLDRALYSLAALPNDIKKRCHFFIIGEDKRHSYIKLAQQLNIAAHVKFLGGRHDVPHFLLAADLLIHPAYHENTGTVLLEALTYGLPVLSVAACGYAYYIEKANAGHIIPLPFCQSALNDALKNMLSSHHQRNCWRQNALIFAAQSDIYQLAEKAVTLIETVRS